MESVEVLNSLQRSVWVVFMLPIKTDENLNRCRSQWRRFWLHGWKTMNVTKTHYCTVSCLYDSNVNCWILYWPLNSSLRFIFSRVFSFRWILCFYVFVAQNRLMGWKHRTVVFGRECIVAYLWFCLALVCRAAKEGFFSGFWSSCSSLSVSFISVLACLSLHPWVCRFHRYVSAHWCWPDEYSFIKSAILSGYCIWSSK